MAAKEEIKRRTEYVKNILKSSDGVSKKELMETLGVQKRTLENTMKSLINAGWDIVNEKGLYYLRNKDEIDNRKEEPESHKTDVYKVLILFCLMDKDGRKVELSEKELYRAVVGEEISGNRDWFASAITSLIDEKQISYHGGKYMLGMNAPRLVVGIYDDYDDTMLINLTRELGSQADSSDAIKRIRTRLAWQYTGNNDGDYDSSVYIRQGRHKNMDAIMGLIKVKLLAVPYMEKALSLTYKNRNGEQVEKRIKVGMLLYSASLDCTYVMGENVDDENDISCLRIAGMEEIHAIDDVPNDVYNSEKYREIYKKMFGIGYGDVENVEIAFADKHYVKSVFDKLYSERKKQGGDPAIFKRDDGRWVYKDEVIGANNLLPYIRRLRFDNCEVIRPARMRAEMKRSAERILNRYGCQGEMDHGK